MSVTTRGQAQIQHAETREIFTIEPDELDWDQIAADEGSMGMEVTHGATIDHPDLGLLTWTLSEYPVGVQDHESVDPGPHTVLENFQLSLDIDDAEDREARITAMVDWFFDNFEDPANETPRPDGDFEYIWGGPYDARDQIGDHFSGDDEALIEAAVQRVERGGTIDWAPVSGSPFHSESDRDDDEPFVLDRDVLNGGRRLDGGRAGSTALADILQSIPTLAAGPVFEEDDRNRLELARWTPSTDVDSTLLHSLSSRVKDLLTQLQGTNAHQDLLAAVRQYDNALNDTPVSITRLYAEGIYLESISARLELDIVSDERPPLPGLVAAALDTVRQLHGTLIGKTKEGDDLLAAAANYRRSPEDQQTLKQSVDRLARVISEATTAFGPKAREVLERLTGQTGQGPRPERSNQVAVSILVSAVTAVAITGLNTIVGDGLAATPLGVGLQTGVTIGSTAAGSFILDHLNVLRAFAATIGPDLTWLSRLTDWIAASRRRGSPG